MPTSKIKDVAARAGVSVASVSRALAGRPGVSEAMRRRVLVAARELDYRPDQVARSLRRRQTSLIGLVISSIENEFFTQIAHAAEQTAVRHGYNLLISSTDERIDREEASIAVLRQQLVAGIILAPAPGDYASRPYLAADLPPIVLINRNLNGAPFPAVLADDEPAAFECVAWLIGQGRRRIGVIGGLADISTTRERLNGYDRALTEFGVTRYRELEVSGGATLEGGYQAACDLMIRANPPDALFIHNNVMVTGAMLALQDLGIAWPSEVEVAGFGAFRAARLYRPPLTLIEQPTYEMANRAMSLLLNRIDRRVRDDGSNVYLPNRLISREAWSDQRADRGRWMRFQHEGHTLPPGLSTTVDAERVARQ